MTLPPLTALPSDDAPIREWCRPLSAKLRTRPDIFWGDPRIAKAARFAGILRRVRARLAKKAARHD